MKIKRVSQIGLGAMGSFFAPRLYEWIGAENYCVIAGGERKKKLLERGITVNGTNYRFPIIDPEDKVEPADLIIMAVKEMDLDQAIRDIKNQVGACTQILCVMNGLDGEERIAAVYGWEHVLYSYMRVSIVMCNGITSYDPNVGCVHFGECKNDVRSERVQAIAKLFESCQIPYEIDKDMLRGMWFKFMTNVGENMTSTLLGIPFGAFGRMEDADFIRRAAMQEVVAIAGKKGIVLGEEDFKKQDATLKTVPPMNKSSTLQDFERGKKTEVELFSGTVIRMGKELGIPTPVNEILYHGIRVLEIKNGH